MRICKLMRKAILTAGVAVADTALAVNLLTNGGFNETDDKGFPKGWSCDNRAFHVVPGEGLSATKTLRCATVSEVGYHFLPSQEFKVRPGMKYAFSVWAKTDDLIPVGKYGAYMIVDWCDENGKWIGEIRTPKRLTHTTPWTLLEGETPVLPENARVGHARMMVARGAKGVAYFDDAAVEPRDVTPIEGLYSSAYRNEVADEDGEVRLFANLFLDPELKPQLDTLNAEFILVDAKGRIGGSFENGLVRFKADKLSLSRAEVVVPVDRIAYGKLPVAFEITSRDGTFKASSSMVLDRRKKHLRRKVAIDRWGRTLVDGKPFLPLGFMCGEFGETEMDVYRRGPFNTVMSYPRMTRQKLDWFDKNGIKVIFPIRNLHAFIPASHLKTAFNHDYPEIVCASLVSRLKDHPALLGWYVNDETPSNAKPQLVRRQRLMCEIDPDHPTYSVIYQLKELRDHIATCDVLGTDPYPINAYPIAAASEWAEATKSAMFGGPVWQVPQAFDYKWIPGTGPEKHGLPNREEIRSMTWQPIACGANGIIYYAFHQLMKGLQGEAFDDCFRNYCDVAQEIVRLQGVLLSVEHPVRVLTDIPKTVRARTWRKDGRDYLLACNLSREAVTVKLELSGGPFAAARPILSGLTTELSGSALTFSLPPIGVEMIVLDK